MYSLQINYMKKIKPLLLIATFVLVFGGIIQVGLAKESNSDVVLFYGRGCPHCSKSIGFLEEIEKKYPDANIYEYEIYFEKENIPLFQKIAEAYNTDIKSVPTIFIGNHVFVGFNNDIGNEIEQAVIECLEIRCISPLQFLEENIKEKDDEIPTQIEEKSSVESKNTVPQDKQENENVSNTIIQNNNDVNEENKKTDLSFTSKITVPAVIGAAVVDAINPCAFAVLIILITTILVSGKRKRALFSGLAFSLSIFISYFLMGLGLYSAIQASGLTHTFYTIIAVLAVFIGLFNLKDYFWYGKWFLMEVPISWRPNMKRLLQSITSVPGAFITGFAVSLFLLPCTSGPYIVILGLLAHATTKIYAFKLLALYNIIFVSPMIIITLAVYFGFTTTDKAEQWRQGKLKILHLIAGIILLALGLIMLGSIWLGYM